MPWMIKITPIQSLKNSILNATVQNIKTKIDVGKSLKKSMHWKKLTSEKEFDHVGVAFSKLSIDYFEVSVTVLCSQKAKGGFFSSLENDELMLQIFFVFSLIKPPE